MHMSSVRSKLFKKTADLLKTNRTSNGMRLRSNRGDTIVEVLLALTIVSSMLGGAYVLSNRSLSNSRGSQERGEALKIAEAQLERLKSSINNGNDDAFNSTNIFCMNESNNVTAATSPTLGLVPALNSAQD